MLSTSRPPLARHGTDRMLGGVAAGLAAHLGVSVVWTRAAFVGFGLLGIGVLIYLAGMLVIPEHAAGTSIVQRYAVRDVVDIAAYAAIAVGAVTLARRALWNGSALVLVPIGVVSFGAALVLALPRSSAVSPSDGPGATVLRDWERGRWLAFRIVVGGVLAFGGAGVLLASSDSWQALRRTGLALAVLLLAVAIVVGPWLTRVSLELLAERRARVVSQERADMAAHLHDSVLQTLAMVQRRADDPREVVRLARQQERELRDWLQRGGAPADRSDNLTFTEALRAVAAELEALHGVPIDVVPVLDCAVTPRLDALLLATREAVANAQVHSGAATVSLYSEVGSDAVVVFVRDRGTGFDSGAVAPDRRGLAESIVGRVQRAGGSVAIRSDAERGTEIEMTMPRTGP